MKTRKAGAVGLAMVLAVSTMAWAAESQTETERAEVSAAETESENTEVVISTPQISHFYPWLTLSMARQFAEIERDHAMLQERADHREALDAAVTDALAQARSEQEEALAQAQSEAQAQLELSLTQAKAQAETELEQALGRAESEKEAALTQAQSEKEAALAQAQSEKAQALEQAQSEKEAALAQAETEKEQAIAQTVEQAQSEKAQALEDALTQWESEQQAQEESEALERYNSSAWLNARTLIRAGNEADAAVLAVTAEDAPVTVLAQKDDVYLIDYYGIRGYVDNGSLTVPETMEEAVASAPGLQAWCKVTLNEAATHLNVRSGPGTDNAVIGMLDSEEIVYLTGNRSEDGAWAEIIFDNGGSTGWSSTKYLTEREEGEPEELTRLMYYADYDKVAELIRSSGSQGGVTVWQNGREVDPETAVGNATMRWENCVYTGEVLGGQKSGSGTQVRVYEEDAAAYERITGIWDGDALSGTVTWSRIDPSDPEKDVTYVGSVVDSYWQGDVSIRAASQSGGQKFFYCYADHGRFRVLAEKDGMSAIAKSFDGEYFYVPSEEAVNEFAAEE